VSLVTTSHYGIEDNSIEISSSLGQESTSTCSDHENFSIDSLMKNFLADDAMDM
jgi:hypothetical protein